MYEYLVVRTYPYTGRKPEIVKEFHDRKRAIKAKEWLDKEYVSSRFYVFKNIYK